MKKFLGIAVLFAAVVTGAFATPAGAITDYMFGVPGDGYMETQWYVGAGFDKFIASTEFNNKANFGFATKVGGLYLGISYGGGIFNQQDFTYTETKNTTPNHVFENKTVKTYATAPNLSAAPDPDHDLGILIGVADMGFKLGFKSTYQLFDIQEDVIVGANNYKSYKTEYGNITPSIKWGMAKNLVENGIRPAVELIFGFNTDARETEQYVNIPPGSATWTTYGKNIVTDNSTTFDLNVNLGGYTLKSTENGFSFSVDFDYGLTSRGYGENQFTWTKPAVGGANDVLVNEKKKGYFTITNANPGGGGSVGTYTYDYTNAVHTIAPSLKATWDSEKIGVGAQIHLPVEISSTEYTRDSLTKNASDDAVVYEKARTYKSTGIGFSPRLNLGGQFRLVPNKFNINMGAEIGLSSARQTETEVEDFNVTPSTTTKTVTPATTGTSSAFSVGATLFFTDNVALDARTGVNNSQSLNFFGTGANITNFSSLYLQIRF